MLHKAKITIGTGFKGEEFGYNAITECQASFTRTAFVAHLDAERDGHQLSECQGSWFDKKQGKRVEEKCLQVTFYQDKEESYADFIASVAYLARTGKRLFWQDTVPVEFVELADSIWV